MVSNIVRNYVGKTAVCAPTSPDVLLLLSVRLPFPPSFCLCCLKESRNLLYDISLPKMLPGTFFSLALLATGGLAKKDWVKGKAFDRIAIIWLENTDYDLAIGDPNLAALAKKGISLTNKFAVTHPSMPNYAAAVSGDYYGINHDDMINIPSNISTVVDLLENKGISWGEYQEGKHS